MADFKLHKSCPCLGMTKLQQPLRLNGPNLTLPYPYIPSDRLGGCNNLTHGKAVFNNKEYGCHLLAQPNGSNVHETSLKYLIKIKCTKITILRKVLLDFSGKYVREDNIRHRSYIMTASTNLYTGEGNESSGLLFPPTRNDNRPLIPLISNVTSQLHREIQKVNSCKPPSFLKGNSYLYLSRLYICLGSGKLNSFLKEIALATLNTKYGG